ncbi:MAG: S28 family serine protease [Bacteroidetes bacterium]|nr:S28 family serine protease [Bacteroidota bacterium]
MKNSMRFVSAFLIILCIFNGITASTVAAQEDKDTLFLEEWLSGLRDIKFEKIDHNEHFKSAYVLYFTQPLDHNNPDGKKFTQRIYLFHRDFNRPVVFVTEGYGADYARHPKMMYELAGMLDANQIVVEHRFFGTSVPDTLQWEYLDIFQAASDHHRIVELFKGLYRGKWVNTGISKGGQTAMYHRYFFPEDVDVTVGYVCPLNFSIADSRVSPFMQNVGDSLCRARIFDFQKQLLERRDQYFPKFLDMAKEQKLVYSIGEEKAYEITAMEYAFAFWQWGGWSCDSIPGPDATTEQVMNHVNEVAGIDWVSDQGIKRYEPFYYQALTEIGFYGYDTRPFGNLIKFLDNPTFTFTCPKGTQCVYNPVPMEEVDQFVRHKAKNMMFIYGEYDPWSSTSVQVSGDNNVIKVVRPGGAHSSRIGNLPEQQKQLVKKTLEQWLNMELKL